MIKFVNTHELETLNLDNYDLFFSTEDNRATEVGLATKINFFQMTKNLKKSKSGSKDLKTLMIPFVYLILAYLPSKTLAIKNKHKIGWSIKLFHSIKLKIFPKKLNYAKNLVAHILAIRLPSFIPCMPTWMILSLVRSC